MKRRHEDTESENEDSWDETASDKASGKSESAKIELENHFIIRFPKDLGRLVTQAIIEGNIHEILTIQLDDDMRYGEVRLDNILLYAKVVDLPTVVESYKTADTVNVYKTADISQLLICHLEPLKEREKDLDFDLELASLDVDFDMFDEEKEQHESNNKDTNEDNNDKEKDKDKDKTATSSTTKEGEESKEVVPIVEEKFLWPHGLTPPFRHLRKRRLNIALRDKNLDPPESDVVKDVKYLLRMDSEAERVDYEVIGDEDVKTDFDLSDSHGSFDTDTDIDILDEDYMF